MSKYYTICNINTKKVGNRRVKYLSNVQNVDRFHGLQKS